MHLSDNLLDELACRNPLSHSHSPQSISNDPGYSYDATTATLQEKIVNAEREIFVLNAENALLREERDNLRLMIKMFLAEIATLRTVLELKRDGDDVVNLFSAHLKTISRLEGQVLDYRKFIRALAEGNILDPRIIAHAQSGVGDGSGPEAMLVDAIQTAASDASSPWSKILPTLTKNYLLEKNAAAVDLVLNLRKDLQDMETVASFWKSQAASTSRSPEMVVSHKLRDARVFEDNITTPSLPQALLIDHMHIRSDLGGLQANGALAQPRSSPSIPPDSVVDQILSSRRKEEKSLSRPSSFEGFDHRTNRLLHQSPIHTKRSRRSTFHDSLNSKAHVIEKRHGFLMPCIKSVLQKHASAPVHPRPLSSHLHTQAKEPFIETSPLGCDPIMVVPPAPTRVLYATHKLSMRSMLALQSAERLCSMWSSGSLGSLEMTDPSASNSSIISNCSSTMTRVRNRPRDGEKKQTQICPRISDGETKTPAINSLTEERHDLRINARTLVNRMSDNDTPTHSPIASQQGYHSAEYPLISSSSSATRKSARGHVLSLPLIRTAARASHPPASQTWRRSTRPCHNIIPPFSLQAKTASLLVLAKKGDELKAIPSVKLSDSHHRKQTFERDETKAYPSNPKAVSSSNRLISLVRAPATAICTPKPRLSMLKSGVIVSAASSRPVNSAKNSISVMQRTELRSLPAPPIQVRLCNNRRPIGTNLTSASHDTNSKPRGRFRVVNKCNSETSEPRTRDLTQSQIRLNTKSRTPTTVTRKIEASHVNDSGRARRANPAMSNTGLMESVDRLARDSRIREARPT
ncbi:hypothetical protein NP233_g197 [Leucocoprinus birnbaumii]|uniref:Uncharacterized protein n=1 Tax=Leucocoprinus birnbaumii TaxID=56174 RepID=A0AAD5W4K4_9AGAR|nr:hypothetical protein NP233_g197 [Leucocoprinus birnbaumii]